MMVISLRTMSPRGADGLAGSSGTLCLTATVEQPPIVPYPLERSRKDSRARSDHGSGPWILACACSRVRRTGTPAPGHPACCRLGRRSGSGPAAAEAVESVFVDDLDDLLARDDIDAVTVTTATSAHHAIMLRAAQAGKHIFTEKLLAPTVAEAEEIIGVADEAGVVLVVSLPRLYHGYTRAIVEQLERGAPRRADLLPNPAV